jgi:hypothetical protein
MKKDELLNKYILYRNKDGHERTEKVVKIVGKTLTLKNAYKEHHRVHPDKYTIIGVYKKTKRLGGLHREEFIEEIDWK